MQQTRSPYQIAMLQMDCDLFHVSNNLDKAEKQIREAAAHGAKLICLPEVFNVGYLGTCIPDKFVRLRRDAFLNNARESCRYHRSKKQSFRLQMGWKKESEPE